MEVGLRGADGIERQEVGHRKGIATLIDVATHVAAVKCCDIALEQGYGGNDEGHVPTVIAFVEGYQRTATLGLGR